MDALVIAGTFAAGFTVGLVSGFIIMACLVIAGAQEDAE